MFFNNIYTYGITLKSHTILLSSSKFNILQLLPRNFTIATNNSSAKFNDFILCKTSSIISDLHRSNPNCFKFHININDEENNLGKLEKILLGESITFDKDNFILFQKIVNCLKICLEKIYLTNNIASTTYYKINLIVEKDSTVSIDKKIINNIIMNESKKFTIQTKKMEYKCNMFGVFSSSIIRELFEKDSKADHYNYEYDDDECQFQFICDILNFKPVKLTLKNSEIISEIAKDLGIDCIMNDITSYLESSEKTVDTVSNEIKMSKWSKTKENVFELAAFIIQIIQSSIELHNDLIDLLIKLDTGNDNENKLKDLLPFIINNVMFLFSEKVKEMDYHNKYLIFPFVYKMYKKRNH